MRASTAELRQCVLWKNETRSQSNGTRPGRHCASSTNAKPGTGHGVGDHPRPTSPTITNDNTRFCSRLLQKPQKKRWRTHAGPKGEWAKTIPSRDKTATAHTAYLPILSPPSPNPEIRDLRYSTDGPEQSDSVKEEHATCKKRAKQPPNKNTRSARRNCSSHLSAGLIGRRFAAAFTGAPVLCRALPGPTQTETNKGQPTPWHTSPGAVRTA